MRILEPLSLDTLTTVGVSLPAEPPGTRRVAHMVYIEQVQLLLTSLDGSPSVVGFDGASGARRVELAGHQHAPPRLRWLLRLQRLATLGGGGAPPFGDAAQDGDCSIRLWKLASLSAPPGSAWSIADGPIGVEAQCERVLLGHMGAVLDATFLPEASLLVSCAADRTIRFWDSEATPHPLTAPEGGAHVRVAPGKYVPMRPEWTTTNPPFVNCLELHTIETPLALAPATGWRGPEGLLVVTAAAATHQGVPSQLDRPPPAALAASGGSVALWAVTRTQLTVEARRFDEVVSKDTFTGLEANAAKDWRRALTMLQEAEAGGGAVAAERRSFDAARHRTMELLRAASLGRPSLSAPMQEGVLRTVFEAVVAEARALESRARGRPKPLGGPSLTLTQVYSLCREHQLLCAPLNNLQSLRRWAIELREFKPSVVARLDAKGAPIIGPALSDAPSRRGVQTSSIGQTPAATASAGPPIVAPASRGEGNAARLGEIGFSRLLNDLDPIARLRDAAFELTMHTEQLARRLPAPRHAARHAAETRAERWEYLAELVVRSLDVLLAHLRAHALSFVRNELAALLPPPPPPFRPRARPPPPALPPPRPPPYEMDRSEAFAEAMEPPRVVYQARDCSGGLTVGCVAVLPQASLVPQKVSGRPLIEHLALEVASSRSLADSCELFTRSVGYALAAPSVNQREHECHLLYEPLPPGTPLPDLIASNGPLSGAAFGRATDAGQGAAAEGGGRDPLPLRHVLCLWGRQLLLALQAAHRRGIVLRTLRLSHIVVSPDGQRIKLGPSALANFALTDGAQADGSGRLISANDLPPLEGALASALSAPPSVGTAVGAPAARSGPGPSSHWGMHAIRGLTGGPRVAEALLPPEVLARELLPARGGGAAADGSEAAIGANAASPHEAPGPADPGERLSSACDVWHVGTFLFEAFYGVPPTSYPECILEHCKALGLEPKAAAPQLLAAAVQPLPSSTATATGDTSGPSAVELEGGMQQGQARVLPTVAQLAYDPFAVIKRREAAARARLDDAGDRNGTVDETGVEELGFPLSAARARIDDAQLPAVSLARASRGDSSSSAPRGPSGASDVANVIAACLQTHPDARPTVDSLLASKLFALDQSTVLTAKRAGAQYVRLPLPHRYVERTFAKPLRDLHRLRLGSGRMPTQNFERLLQGVVECCTAPFGALLSGTVRRASGNVSAITAALSNVESRTTGARAPSSVQSTPDGTTPSTAAEVEACQELLEALVVRFNVWGCLRMIALEDLYELVEGGEELPRTDPRCSSLLKLGRALRAVISHADVEGSFVRPHVGALLSELVSLAAGDVGLKSSSACLASEWLLSHMPKLAAALAGSSTDTASGNAARSAAAAAAAAARGGGATGRGKPALSSDGRLMQTSELYTKVLHPFADSGAPWQYYAPQSTQRWSPTVQTVLHPIIEVVLGEDGAGSFALPALRESLRAHAGNSGARPNVLPKERRSSIANRYDEFPPTEVSGDRKAPPSVLLPRGYYAEVVLALASLRGLQPSSVADSGREARRARCTALTHFSGMLRRKAALGLCADIRLPQHAFTALADSDHEVRSSALTFFLRLAELQPEGGAGVSDGDTIGSIRVLRACFEQHALMHALARPLHDAAEVRGVRTRAVELMACLAATDNPLIHTAMARAGVWNALVTLVPPCKVAGEHVLVDLGARAIFETAAMEGTPAMLAFLQARPKMRQRLSDLGLRMPSPPTLATLALRARSTLVAEGDDAGLPPPPPLPPGTRPPPQRNAAAARATSALLEPSHRTALASASELTSAAVTAAERERTADERRELEHQLAAEMEEEGPADSRTELRLLTHAGACLRQPWAHHAGDAVSRRAYLHAILVFAVRRADRSFRTLQVGAQRDRERVELGLIPASADAARTAVAGQAATNAALRPSAVASIAGAHASIQRDLPSTNVLGSVRSPNQTPNEVRTAAARAAAAAAAISEAEVAAERCVHACMRIFHAIWGVRATSEVDATGLLLLSGAVEWIIRAALPRPDIAAAVDLTDDASGQPGVAGFAFGFAHPAMGLAPPPPVLAHACQLPLLRTQRCACEVLVKQILPAAALPGFAPLVERTSLAKAAVDALQQQQHELSAALELADHAPRLFLQEYDASRAHRLRLWAVLIRAPAAVTEQLVTANAVDRLILTGALPHTTPFELPLIKLPASFVAHHGGMALRLEGLQMLAALVEERERQPALFEQLLRVLQRDRCLVREVSRLKVALANARALSQRDENLCASVVTLMLVLDSAADLRVWQLLHEADAARTIHQIALQAPEMPPISLDRLLEGEHTHQKPLLRAASTFISVLREYERTRKQTHPLMMQSMRGDA